MDLSAPGSRFNTMVMKEPISDNFTDQEMDEMAVLAEEDASNGFGQMIDDDMTTTCSSYPGSRGRPVTMETLLFP